MNIEPGTTVPLVYQNVVYATDQTLLYVKAVIKDSISGTTLDSKNLTHQGTGRYTSSFLAPQDTSGEGRHIDVTITIYTDSGYTTKSPDYQERNFTYVLKSSHQFGGGGGSSIDYEYIQKIFLKLLEEKFAPLFQALEGLNKEEKTLDLSSIEQGQQMLLSLVSEVKGAIKPSKEVDLSIFIKAVEKIGKNLSKKIEDKEVTEATDVSQVVTAILKIKGLIEDNKILLNSNKKEISDAFKDSFKEYVSDIEAINNKIKEDIEKTPLSPEILKYFPGENNKPIVSKYFKA